MAWKNTAWDAPDIATEVLMTGGQQLVDSCGAECGFDIQSPVQLFSSPMLSFAPSASPCLRFAYRICCLCFSGSRFSPCDSWPSIISICDTAVFDPVMPEATLGNGSV
ncbi:hypothetical protein VTI74DRAFT_3878 [Chaetomium olivicolor]